MNLFNVMAKTDYSTICSTEGSFKDIWNLVGIAVQFLLIGIPVILVLFGLMDLGKAVMAGKDEEIKGAQKLLIKRIIYTIVAFLLIAIVKGVLTIAGGDQAGSVVTKCLNVIFN